jgi:RNase P/RNase MRP subunit p29
MKAGVPYVVKSGELTKLEENVIFPNGNVLRLEGILASRTRLIRLQDGQRLGLTGEVIPALDHIMMANGKLVLQKDGSIIPLPVVSSMGMSEGTRVTGSGLITTTTGEQFALSDGQRLTVDGAAMLMSP